MDSSYDHLVMEEFDENFFSFWLLNADFDILATIGTVIFGNMEQWYALLYLM